MKDVTQVEQTWKNLGNMESLGLKCKMQHKLKTKKYNFGGLGWDSRLQMQDAT